MGINTAITVDARTYTTGADIIRNAKAIRDRLFSPPKGKRQDERQWEALKQTAVELPLWKTKSITFNAHVLRYRLHLASLSREQIVRGLPLWRRSPIMFNAHVVDYRRYVLALEEGRELEDYSGKVSVSDIIADVLTHFNDVTVSDLKGVQRDRKFTVPRQLVFFEVRRRRPDLSLPAVGRIFNRDHTTVLHGCRKIEELKSSGDLDWFFNADRSYAQADA